MFCRICGEKTERKKVNDNFNTKEMVSNENPFPYEITCKNGHKSYSMYPETCPDGMKPVRTKVSNGFQTSHIPKDWDEKEWKDKNYHAVNVFLGFNRL